VRVLDIDLDFFLHGTAHYADSSDSRLDAKEYPSWPLAEVLTFLTDRCQLRESRPGFVVEHHHEIFYLWGEAIETGGMSTPLDVVHIDAHADLGVGDASYAYLIGDLAFEPIKERYETLRNRRPASRSEMLDLSNYALTDGNWLMFALACGWLSGLTYVSNSCVETAGDRRPNDLNSSVMKDFDTQADFLQVVATREKFWELGRGRPKTLDQVDPPVPFATRVWREYHAAEPFDIVCLTRSPEYTPATSDPIFDAIAERFIDEAALR
jgi:hypothetical protein